jgi:hypothetical protein
MGKFAAVAVTFMLALSGCEAPPCKNEISARVPSPSGRLEAIIFSRGCGATTDFNTQLSVLPKGGVPAGTGNALILGGSVPLTLAWRGETALVVKGLAGSEVFKQEGRAHGASVSYQQ